MGVAQRSTLDRTRKGRPVQCKSRGQYGRDNMQKRLELGESEKEQTEED